MYPVLYPNLYPVEYIVLKIRYILGIFYVGEPLKLRNSKTTVLESYPWNKDSPNLGNLLKIPVW